MAYTNVPNPFARGTSEKTVFMSSVGAFRTAKFVS